METHVFLSLLLCSGALGSCSYSRHLKVSAPNLEALSGSCLLMPCTFTISPDVEHLFDPTKPVTAIWSQNHAYLGRQGEDRHVVYNSDRPGDTSPMKMLGNRTEKNCTTLFLNVSSVHSGRYFLRIESDRFKMTTVCDPLEIQVKDSPWSPSIEVSGLLKEKETVTITCSAPTPCPHSPPKLSLNLHQDPQHTMVRLPDGTFITSIQQKMTLSEHHDKVQVSCTAVYPVDGGEKRADSSFSLTVDYASVGIGPYNIVKICGIVILFTALLLIECLIREKTTEHQQSSVPEEADYINCVVESHT